MATFKILLVLNVLAACLFIIEAAESPKLNEPSRTKKFAPQLGVFGYSPAYTYGAPYPLAATYTSAVPVATTYTAAVPNAATYTRAVPVAATYTAIAPVAATYAAAAPVTTTYAAAAPVAAAYTYPAATYTHASSLYHAPLTSTAYHYC